MLFLFGVFVIGRALEESGYLGHIAGRLFGRAGSMDSLILLILFGMGILSAFLMNDTLAIIGTPVMLALAARTDAQPKLLLLSLAFAVTIGSVTSPIGNPQNLLIALHGGVPNPFHHLRQVPAGADRGEPAARLPAAEALLPEAISL